MHRFIEFSSIRPFFIYHPFFHPSVRPSIYPFIRWSFIRLSVLHFIRPSSMIYSPLRPSVCNWLECTCRSFGVVSWARVDGNCAHNYIWHWTPAADCHWTVVVLFTSWYVVTCVRPSIRYGLLNWSSATGCVSCVRAVTYHQRVSVRFEVNVGGWMEGGRSVEEEEEEEEEVGDGSREDSDGLAWKEFFGKWDN